jgi:putative membrane protein
MWHTDGMFSSGWHGLSMFFWLIILIVAVVLLVKALSKKRDVPSNALNILDERYAAGEITDEEYKRRKSELNKQ